LLRIPCGANKMSRAAKRIIQGLREAAAHARGTKVPSLRLHVPKQIDVCAIRRRTGLSQKAFSSRIGVSTGTLRNWEQGRRNPEGPARVLLAMLARNPRVVEETLEKSLRSNAPLGTTWDRSRKMTNTVPTPHDPICLSLTREIRSDLVARMSRGTR
jgi:putative transcriptional regulator